MNKRSAGSSPNRKTLVIIAIGLGIFGMVVGFTVGNPVFGAVGAVAVLIGGINLALMS